jgi:hypothetical protein
MNSTLAITKTIILNAILAFPIYAANLTIKVSDVKSSVGMVGFTPTPKTFPPMEAKAFNNG